MYTGLLVVLKISNSPVYYTCFQWFVKNSHLNVDDVSILGQSNSRPWQMHNKIAHLKRRHCFVVPAHALWFGIVSVDTTSPYLYLKFRKLIFFLSKWNNVLEDISQNSHTHLAEPSGLSHGTLRFRGIHFGNRCTIIWRAQAYAV